LGCSLEQGQIVRITPMKGLEDSPYVLVASHSCDIVNPKEPFIEILPCHEIEMADGVNKGGRNQRTWDFSMGTHVFRVIAYEKVKIEKEAFSTINPEKDMIGKVEDLSLFQEWLASRYFRQTLPDCINQLLLEKLKLRKVVEHCGPVLQRIWLYLAPIPDTSGEHVEDYETMVYFVFDGDEEQRKLVQQMMTYVTNKEMMMQSQNLGACVSIEVRRDDQITLMELHGLVAFNFDYLSYRKKTS
jgi:hypothetical protein